MSDAFEKIAIVTDRDNREVSAIETEAAAFLKVPCDTIKNNQWNDCSYTNECGYLRRNIFWGAVVLCWDAGYISLPVFYERVN